VKRLARYIKENHRLVDEASKGMVRRSGDEGAGKCGAEAPGMRRERKKGRVILKDAGR